MIKCEISGRLVKVVPSRDNLNLCLNIACYENSNYSVSVLKVPLDRENSFVVGEQVCVSVVPRAFYSNGKAKVLYYFNNKS